MCIRDRYNGYHTGDYVRSNVVQSIVNSSGENVLIQAVKKDDSTDSGVNFLKWSPSPQSALYSDDAAHYTKFRTKEFDFGEPSLRKKIYKIYITYKSDGQTQLHPQIEDGSGGEYGFSIDKSIFSGTTTNCLANVLNTAGTATPCLATTGDVFKVAELVPTSSINNIFSFIFELKGIAHTTGGNSISYTLPTQTTYDMDDSFEITDITVVYRVKAPR